MSSKFFQLSALAVGILLGLSAQAQETGKSAIPKARAVQDSSELRPHIGVLIGAAQPEGSGVTASEFGLDVGYQPYIPFGLSAEFNHSRIDNGSESKDRNTIWAKGTYNFGGDIAIIKDSYVGVGLGTVFKSDGTSLAAAPIIGFDIPLKNEDKHFLSLGASSRYAVVSDGEVDTFSLAGVVKYWY